MAELVKNQHYVPQRYLRYFSNKVLKKNKCISRFNVFDKLNLDVRQNQNIENLASERYFYDVDFESLLEETHEEGIEVEQDYIELIKEVDKQEMEHTFATKVETTMYDPIAQIVTNYMMTQKSVYADYNVIPENKRAVIAYYLILQYLRTKEFREKVIQMYEQGGMLIMNKALHGKVNKDFLNNTRLKLKESHINLIHNQYLLDTEHIEELSLALLGHIWYIAVNETNTQFYTSDNPLVFHGHLGRNGLKAKGIEIIFPITPKLALIMRDLDFFNHDIIHYNKFINVDEEYVKYCNSLQVYQSYRYIFSKDNNFSDAEALLKKHPELKDMEKNRFVMC